MAQSVYILGKLFDADRDRDSHSGDKSHPVASVLSDRFCHQSFLFIFHRRQLSFAE
jgi:hypothetical protein